MTMQADKEEFLIEDFLRDKDVTPWFRGTSIFHLQGSNKLLNAIRDDTEQRTAHRVKNCLNLIGLDPMITSRDIKLLMRLSRGNDLAFLWFLMEMHYKNPNPSTYNVNEQLICSAICHLDMITTLRALDKILPRGQAAKTIISESRQECLEAKQSLSKTKAKIIVKPEYILPYFEKIRRPQVYGKSLVTDLPNFKVDFGLYNSYADSSYVVHNESNRWYAEYDFNPGRRVAYDVIRNAIANIFDNFEAVRLNANTVKMLCDYHKTLKKIEDDYKHALRVKIRDRCLKTHLGYLSDKKKERRQRIRESLHTAIEQKLCEFRKQVITARKKFTLKALTSDCDIINVIVGEECNDMCKPLQLPVQLQTKSSLEKVITQEPKEPIGDSLDHALLATNLNKRTVDRLALGQTLSELSIFASKYMQNYDYGHVASTPRHSQTFFHTPTRQKPQYVFDYRKIFSFPDEKVNDKETWIRKTFLNALDTDVSTFIELQEAQRNLGCAAYECAHKTWNAKVAKHNDSQREESLRPLQQYPDTAEYDAEDKNLMDKMLDDAIKYLRQNPKFVLAQLPDAHKLPMLREWIFRRYGKVYSPIDRSTSYRYSLKIFHALDRMTFDFPIPTSTQLGNNKFVSYACKNYLTKKVKYIKNQYYRRLDNAIMMQSRNYWFAMRGYLCSNGPPRATFFAYMPSCFRDIQRFRLWRSSEHRQDKTAWDKRRLAKNPNNV